MKKSKFIEIASSVADEFEQIKKDEFTHQEFWNEVASRCEAAKLQKHAFEDAVTRAVDYVDEQRARGRSSPQDSTLPGIDLSGWYRLGKVDGEARKVSKRASRAEHMLTHLGIMMKNASASQQAAEAVRDEFAKLQPYWGPGVQKEQAARSYRRDHPEDEAS